MTGRITSNTIEALIAKQRSVLFHQYNPFYGYNTTSSYDRKVVYSHIQLKHCLKNAPYSAFFWSVYSHIQTECRDLICKSSYSVQMWEKSDQKNSECGQFSHNGI